MDLLFGNLNEDEIIIHTEYIKEANKILKKKKIWIFMKKNQL
jgi:hypothetical protein